MGLCQSRKPNEAVAIGLRFSYRTTSQIGGNIFYGGVQFHRPASAAHTSPVDGAKYDAVIHYCSHQMLLLGNKGAASSKLVQNDEGHYKWCSSWHEHDQTTAIAEGVASFKLSGTMSPYHKYYSPTHSNRVHVKKLSIIPSDT